jgi:hypothetical protein
MAAVLLTCQCNGVVLMSGRRAHDLDMDTTSSQMSFPPVDGYPVLRPIIRKNVLQRIATSSNNAVRRQSCFPSWSGYEARAEHRESSRLS